MSFTAELQREVRGAQDKINRVWQTSVAQAFNEVVQMTPVDKGGARASWLMAQSPDNNIGTQVLSPSPADIPRVGGTFTLYSNIPYMERLEFGTYPQPGSFKTTNGFSSQAPQGMVRVTAADWDRIVKENS